MALAGGAAAVVAGGSAGCSWRMMPVVAPPVMWDPAYASPDDAQQSGALPTDPYTSLKQNYEAVIGFLTLVSEGPQDTASTQRPSASRHLPTFLPGANNFFSHGLTA